MKVFFDTMIFLHYRSLDQIDLTQILGPPPHTLLIPRITLRELDKHKNTHRSNRIQERARKVLKKIEAWAGGNEVRTGVSAEFLSVIPMVDYAKLGLNPDWNDDILIATVLQYKTDHPDEAIILVTQDSGPRMTASQLGIAVLELPAKWKLPVEPDPIEVENRELAKTIAALQNALPKLVASFEGTDEPQQYATFALPPPPESMEHEIERKLAELKTKLPKQHPPQPDPKSTASLFQSQLSSLGHIALITPEEYERYNIGVDEYIGDYERYMRDTWEAQAATKRSLRLEIEIRNIGNSPAEDVDVLLHFPDGFRLFSEDDFPSLPEEPRPPRKPRTSIQMMTESISYIPRIDLGRPALPDFSMPGSFSIERTASYNVRDHFQRIKHGDRVVLPEMFLTFDSYEAAGSFSCHYTIRPANLPEAITGELHFVIEKECANKAMDSDKE